MKYYPKIQSVYKRDNKTHKFIEGSFSLPEFLDSSMTRGCSTAKTKYVIPYIVSGLVVNVEICFP